MPRMCSRRLLANAPDSDDGDDQRACQGAAPTGHGRARRDGDDPHHDDAVPKNHQCGAKDAKPDRPKSTCIEAVNWIKNPDGRPQTS